MDYELFEGPAFHEYCVWSEPLSDLGGLYATSLHKYVPSSDWSVMVHVCLRVRRNVALLLPLSQ